MADYVTEVVNVRNCQITFVNEKITYQADEGMTVMEAQKAAGIVVDAPCGGNGKCGKCRVRINGETLLACRTEIHGDMCVETAAQQETQILVEGVSGNVVFAPEPYPEETERPLLAAVDLGTTTVVVYLMDGTTGKLLSVKSMMNPQRQYGADVVMRSSYAMEQGAEALSGCIRRAVSVLLREAAREAGASWEDIMRIVMVGNSCMHHLFLELPLNSLVLAPYQPVVREAVRRKASDCGILVHPQAELCWLPLIGGFVGADTVGCVLASRIDLAEEMTLIVDIGTNGEMVLGNRDGCMACSTAAGPAFEGARITCGMRGNAGAIDHVRIENGGIRCHVIGDGEPTGICGSGLLDAAACFLEAGIMDAGGKLKETYYFTPMVFINQKDIRELQLAKAAIAAGIRLLCAHMGIRVCDIRQVLLAGAFGNYLEPESACRTGLLPQELAGRIRSIGNAAGEGARIAVSSGREYARASELARQIRFLELASDAEFQDIYVDELGFPE